MFFKVQAMGNLKIYYKYDGKINLMQLSVILQRQLLLRDAAVSIHNSK